MAPRRPGPCRVRLIRYSEAQLGIEAYFEDFETGDEIRHWPGKTVTESDNQWFSLMTMNQHPLHLDREFARTTQHGDIVVVGTYVFALVVGMTVRDLSARAIANLRYDEVVHHVAVFPGDTLHAESVVLDVRESRSKPDRGIVEVRTTGRNQRGEPVISFRRSILIPKRPKHK